MKARFKNGLMGVAAASLALLASAPGAQAGTDPYLGEIMYTIGHECPKNWVKADGRIMKISQSSGLFSLLGAKFGGDGKTTFALPDLRGRTVVGAGGNFSVEAPLGNLSIGAKGGAETATIVTPQTPIRSTLSKAAQSGSITAANSGEAAPIETMPPWIGLTACIATTGIYRQIP
jgi:microcystin-dependent protein